MIVMPHSTIWTLDSYVRARLSSLLPQFFQSTLPWYPKEISGSSLIATFLNLIVSTSCYTDKAVHTFIINSAVSALSRSIKSTHTHALRPVYKVSSQHFLGATLKPYHWTLLRRPLRAVYS